MPLKPGTKCGMQRVQFSCYNEGNGGLILSGLFFPAPANLRVSYPGSDAANKSNPILHQVPYKRRLVCECEKDDQAQDYCRCQDEPSSAELAPMLAVTITQFNFPVASLDDLGDMLRRDLGCYWVGQRTNGHCHLSKLLKRLTNIGGQFLHEFCRKLLMAAILRSIIRCRIAVRCFFYVTHSLASTERTASDSRHPSLIRPTLMRARSVSIGGDSIQHHAIDIHVDPSTEQLAKEHISVLLGDRSSTCCFQYVPQAIG